VVRVVNLTMRNFSLPKNSRRVVRIVNWRQLNNLNPEHRWRRECNGVGVFLSQWLWTDSSHWRNSGLISVHSLHRTLNFFLEPIVWNFCRWKHNTSLLSLFHILQLIYLEPKYLSFKSVNDGLIRLCQKENTL
jgi:hypothetical protein